MTDTEIIAQLTRENLEYEECLVKVLEVVKKINLQCVGCGRPLNDNKKCYNSEQLKDFSDINEEAEYSINLIEGALSIFHEDY